MIHSDVYSDYVQTCLANTVRCVPLYRVPYRD